MNLGFSQSSSNIYINGEEIRTTENLKLLGVTLDIKLNFSDHITSICKKASQRIGVLIRLRLRAVFRDYNANYEQRLRRAELPTLLNRRLQDMCTLMYKVKRKLCPSYISNIFNEHNSKYNLQGNQSSLFLDLIL